MAEKAGALGVRFAMALLVLSCSAPPDDAPTSEISLVAEMRIGSETSGPEYQFTSVNFLAVHGDYVFVAQRNPPEIRVFGSDGVFRHAVGRQGSGPGEFQSIWSMGIVGDSLWTIDIDLRRLTFFTLAGSVISTVPFDPVPPALGQGLLFLAYQDVLLPGGDFLGFGRGAGVSIARGDITANPLLRMGPDGRAVDTLAWVSIKNDDMILKSSRSTMYRPQPFSDAALTVFAPDIQRAYVIERWAAVDAKSASMQVTAIDATGDTAWTREIPYTAMPLDRHLVDDVRRKLEKGLVSVFPKDEINRALFAPTYRTPITAAL